MDNGIKIIVLGTPISKSNFKLNSKYGRYILPYNSGKYHDRYGVYEEFISYEVRRQHPNLVLNSSLTAILKVFYKYEKRHPDTNNITKSIFDGIEKSGLILNDAQITKLFIEEFYDKENPRFELTLFENHLYDINVSITKRENPIEKITYSEAINKKSKSSSSQIKPKSKKEGLICYVCEKLIKDSDFIKVSNSSNVLCRNCLKKTN